MLQPGLILLALLFLFPLNAGADPVVWTSSDTIVTRELGRVSGRSLIAIRREQAGAGADLLTIRVSLQWQGPDLTPREHILTEGNVAHDIALENISVSGQTLTYVVQPTSRYEEEGSYTRVTLRYRERPGDFVETRRVTQAPYSEARKTLEALLKRGKFEAARALIEVMGTTPNGGHTNLDVELFGLFLQATVREVGTATRHGRIDEAAALALSLVTEPPVGELCEVLLDQDTAWYATDSRSPGVRPRGRGLPGLYCIAATHRHIEEMRSLAKAMRRPAADSLLGKACHRAASSLEEDIRFHEARSTVP